MNYFHCGHNKQTNQKKKAGFTLVELSIVLVIIGLIVASVLVGQDLIRQAELRATVTQYEQFQAAAATFRTKYGGIPGDVEGAADYGFTGDGDNDEVLDDGDDDGSLSKHSGELVYFWNHLGATGAGLISGTYAGATLTGSNISSELPSAKAGNYWGVYSASTINYYLVGVVDTATTYTTDETLSPIDSYNIDGKVDDGRPNRGIVRARDIAASGAPDQAPEAGTTTGDCVDSTASTGIYNTDLTDASCLLRFRM